MAASRARSVGSSVGRGVCRRRTASWWREDEDLQILGGVATGQLNKQLDGAAHRQVGESWQHLGAASAMG